MIDYTLSVTSPLTTGPKVMAAQLILNDGNVFARDFLNGPVDGVFGEQTGRACIAAKYWLGYATGDLRPTFGEALDAYLEGRQMPSAAMVKRQELRQAAHANTPDRSRALVLAKGELGTKEHPPGTNRVKYSDWYGIRGPWCAMFVTWCYVGAGSDVFVKGSRYAYVPYIVADARAGRHKLHVITDPKPGDLVCYDWDGGVADHVGLFEKWASESHDTFAAVEGNTAVGNDSNGGEVMRRNRRISQVECFVRVGR